MPSIPLRPEDLLVQFRDKNLVKQGSIPIDDLSLKMQPVYNGIGSWSISLPAEHRAVPYLRTPGSGIVVTNLRTGQTLLSGPTSKPSKRATASDPTGMATIAGLTDDRILWDALAAPQPANANFTTQTVANDVRTGKGESLMRQYVAYNIANGAIAVGGATAWAPAGRLGGFRSFLRLQAADSGLGVVTTRRPRFDVLGDLLVGIALEQGLGFRVVQVGSVLEFQVYQPTNRSSTIRLDVVNGTLQEQSVEFAPPEVTRMLTAGQGEGTARQFVSTTTAASVTAEADWGLIIEEFKDQRNTNVTDELTASALERLNEAGFTKVAVKAVPSNDQTMIFMTDFFLGDKVAIVIDGQEQPNSSITEAAIVVDRNGLRTAVAIGDIYDFDSDSALRQTVNDNTRRLDNLERNAEQSVLGVNTSAMVGEMKIWPMAAAPAGWLLCRGQAVSRTTYAQLFAALGTTFGAGDGSTTFNLPPAHGRVLVGMDPAQTEFDALGELSGAKTHTLSDLNMPMSTVQYATGSNFYSPITGGNTSQYRAKAHANPATSQDAISNLQPGMAVNFIIKT